MIVVAAVAGVVFGGVTIARKMEEKRLATEWARFSRCLVGPPLGAAETPASRLRSSQLGMLERKLSRAPAPSDADWPRRCATYAGRLARDWDDPLATMVGALRNLIPLFERGEVPSTSFLGPGSYLDEAFGAAAGMPGKPDDVSDVPVPPKGASLLETVTAAKLSDETHIWDAAPLIDRSVRWLPYRTGTMLEIDGSPDPARTLLHAHATKISEKIPTLSQAKLVGVEDGVAPVFALSGFAGRGGLYSGSTGELLVPSPLAPSFGGWAKTNGFTATIDNVVLRPGAEVVNEATYHIVRRAPNGVVTRTALDRPKWNKDRVSSARVFAGWLFWVEGPFAVDTVLHAREIFEGEPAVGPVVNIGKLPNEVVFQSDARVCRSGDALFVELHDGKSVTPVRAVAGFGAGKWHAPIRTEGARGVLTCSAGRAVYTGIDITGPEPSDGSTKAPAEVHRTTCTFDACAHESVTLPDVLVTRDDIKEAHVSAVALAGDVVAVANHGMLRVAPLAELPRARVRILVAEPLDSNTLFTREGVGVLLLGLHDGARAFRIGGDGALSPVDMPTN